MFSLSQFSSGEAITEWLNTNISNAFELYRSLFDRKERGSFTFSASGSSHFKSKLLDRALDDMVCAPLKRDEEGRGIPSELSSTSKSATVCSISSFTKCRVSF